MSDAEEKNATESLAAMERLATLYRQTISVTEDPDCRQNVAVALEAVERRRRGLLKEIQKKFPVIFDAMIDKLEKQLY